MPSIKAKSRISSRRSRFTNIAQFHRLLFLLAVIAGSRRSIFRNTSLSAEAKLLLWPERYDDEYNNEQREEELSKHEQFKENKPKIKKKEELSRFNSIVGRLRRFHGHDDNIHYSQTQPYENSIDQGYSYSTYLAKYIRMGITWGDLMLQYIQNRIYGTVSSSDGNVSTSAFTLFQQTQQYKDMIAEPRDAWEGLLSAFMALRHGYVGGMHSLVGSVYEIGHGSISACMALWQGVYGMQQHQQPGDNMPVLSFVSELSYGLQQGAQHAADGFILFAAGAFMGARNLVVGIARTPEAIRSNRLGMLYYPQGKKQYSQGAGYDDGRNGNSAVGTWDYYSLDYEDKEIQREEHKLKEELGSDFPSPKPEKKKASHNIRRRRTSALVKDRKYYEILGVSTDANTADIRSAYRREALRRHPDKQPASTSTSSDGSSSQPPIEGFLDLTEAYRILSNDASRDAYDQFGTCFREESLSGEDYWNDEAGTQDLMDELFGIEAVTNFVGNIQIKAIVNEVFGFSKASDQEGQNSNEIRNLQQRRRVVDIAKYLRDRVNSVARGEITVDEFANSCREEATYILREGGEFSDAFLTVIGRTLLQEADGRIGYVLPFVKKASSDFGQLVTSKIASARVYAPIYFRVALEGMVSTSYYDTKSDESDTDDCSSGKRSNKHPVDQDAVLDLLWQYVVNDSVQVLREACEKLFADRGVKDVNLAFVQTPSLLKHQRAEALKILAREFLAVSTQARSTSSK